MIYVQDGYIYFYSPSAKQYFNPEGRCFMDSYSSVYFDRLLEAPNIPIHVKTAVRLYQMKHIHTNKNGLYTTPDMMYDEYNLQWYPTPEKANKEEVSLELFIKRCRENVGR